MFESLLFICCLVLFIFLSHWIFRMKYGFNVWIYLVIFFSLIVLQLLFTQWRRDPQFFGFRHVKGIKKVMIKIYYNQTPHPTIKSGDGRVVRWRWVNFQYQGVLLIWIMACNRCELGLFGHFFSSVSFLFFLPLSERYRLIYSLKGPTLKTKSERSTRTNC